MPRRPHKSNRKKRYKKRHLLMQKLARGRIEELTEIAKQTHSEDPKLANRCLNYIIFLIL